MNTPTPSKVSAVNALGVLYNQLLPTLLAAAQEIVSNRIQVSKAGGGLTVAARKALPALPQCCWYSCKYGLDVHLTADASSPEGHSFRAQTSVYLMGGISPGETPYVMRNHVPTLRADWTLEEVKGMFDEIRALESQANAKRNALHLFI